MKNIFIYLFIGLLFFSFGCREKSQKNNAVEKKQEPQTSIYNSIQEELFAEGIDFMARGNEPFWSLDIDFENSMKFTSLTEISELITPAVDGVKEADADVTRYRAVTESGELIVTVIADSCIDNMSGERFPLTVKVDVKLDAYDEYREFKGCGRYLFDMRLNDSWVLIELNGKKIDSENSNGNSPSLDIDGNMGKISGSGGCNRIMGSVNIIGEKIEFGMIASTMMACPNMEIEREFLTIISEKKMEYRIKDANLYMTDEKGNELVFSLNSENNGTDSVD